MRSGVVGLMPGRLEDVDAAVVGRLRSAGFTGVSVVVRAAEPTRDELTRVRDTLADAGVRVAQINADYEMLVSPDEARRQAGIHRLASSCRWARWLGSTNTYVRPGSLNPRGPWLPHRDNTLPQTIDRLVDSLKQVAAAAEQEGVYLALEGHTISPLDTPERVRDVVQAVGSSSLRFNADPVNFLTSLSDLYESEAFLDRFFDLMAPLTICAHVKDALVEDRLVLHIAECVPGDGLLDLGTFLRRFEQACPDGYVLIEHLPDDRIPRAKAHVDATLRAAGLTWVE